MAKPKTHNVHRVYNSLLGKSTVALQVIDTNVSYRLSSMNMNFYTE